MPLRWQQQPLPPLPLPLRRLWWQQQQPQQRPPPPLLQPQQQLLGTSMPQRAALLWLCLLPVQRQGGRPHLPLGGQRGV